MKSLRTVVFSAGFFATSALFLTDDLFAQPTVTLSEEADSNGSASPAPTPTVTATATATATPTLTPVVTPTSTPSATPVGCVHPVTIINKGYASGTFTSCSGNTSDPADCINTNADQKVFDGAASELGCLQHIVDSCVQSTNTVYNSSLTGITVANLIAATDPCGMYYGCDRDVNSTFSLADVDDCVAGSVNGFYTSSRGTALDQDCNLVNPANFPGICTGGVIGVNFLESPISLVWNMKADLNGGTHIVQFPLNPSHPEQFYLWKASGDFPLLVWDPDHVGRISSAHQLFGTYALGKEWKNGYQALATLDADKDGKLSGAELANLALWFDTNQNGVSESGEVKTLAEVGVEEIYVKPSRIDKRTGDIFAEKGFAVRTDSKLVTGYSVDWFGKAYASEMSAVAALQGLAFNDRSGTSSQALQPAAKSAASANDPVSGVWYWTVGKANRYSPKGIFTLKMAGQQITGHTYVEIPAQRNSGGIRSVVMSSPITGSVTKAADGSFHLHFMAGKGEKLTTSSDAIISANGSLISGESISSYMNASTKTTLDSLTYRWSAKRKKS